MIDEHDNLTLDLFNTNEILNKREELISHLHLNFLSEDTLNRMCNIANQKTIITALEKILDKTIVNDTIIKKDDVIAEFLRIIDVNSVSYLDFIDWQKRILKTNNGLNVDALFKKGVITFDEVFEKPIDEFFFKNMIMFGANIHRRGAGECCMSILSDRIATTSFCGDVIIDGKPIELKVGAATNSYYSGRLGMGTISQFSMIQEIEKAGKKFKPLLKFMETNKSMSTTHALNIFSEIDVCLDEIEQLVKNIYAIGYSQSTAEDLAYLYKHTIDLIHRGVNKEVLLFEFGVEYATIFYNEYKNTAKFQGMLMITIKSRKIFYIENEDDMRDFLHSPFVTNLRVSFIPTKSTPVEVCPQFSILPTPKKHIGYQPINNRKKRVK